MTPPHVLPPLLHRGDLHGNVTLKWLAMGSQAAAPLAGDLQWNPPHSNERESGELLECVQMPGEVVYLPSLWWHATIDVTDTASVAEFHADP